MQITLPQELKPEPAPATPRPSPEDRLALGVWKHYKGGHYLVLGVGRHESTHEGYVVYVPLYGDASWLEGASFVLRPVVNWFEEVVIDGRAVPRFTFVSSEVPSEGRTLTLR